MKLKDACFANKGPYSQSYGFSSSRVWMWDLDHNEGWMLREVLGKSNYNMAEGMLLFSHVRLLVTPWTIAHQAHLSFTISQSLLKLMPIESMMLSNHLILCRPLLLLSIFPSIRGFPGESALPIRCPKYWSFSFSISPSNEYSRLISFRIDCFGLLAVQGTLKSFLQHHSSKA